MILKRTIPRVPFSSVNIRVISVVSFHEKYYEAHKSIWFGASLLYSLNILPKKKNTRNMDARNGESVTFLRLFFCWFRWFGCFFSTSLARVLLDQGSNGTRYARLLSNWILCQRYIEGNVNVVGVDESLWPLEAMTRITKENRREKKIRQNGNDNQKKKKTQQQQMFTAKYI